jgi:hypothetical protein
MDADVLTRFDVMEVVELLVARRSQFEFSRLAAAHRFVLNAVIWSGDRPRFEPEFFGEFLHLFADCDPPTASVLLDAIDRLVTQAPTRRSTRGGQLSPSITRRRPVERRRRERLPVSM